MNENIGLNINDHVILLITVKRRFISTFKTERNYVGEVKEKKNICEIRILDCLDK